VPTVLKLRLTDNKCMNVEGFFLEEQEKVLQNIEGKTSDKV